ELGLDGFVSAQAYQTVFYFHPYNGKKMFLGTVPAYIIDDLRKKAAACPLYQAEVAQQQAAAADPYAGELDLDPAAPHGGSDDNTTVDLHDDAPSVADVPDEPTACDNSEPVEPEKPKTKMKGADYLNGILAELKLPGHIEFYHEEGVGRG